MRFKRPVSMIEMSEVKPQGRNRVVEKDRMRLLRVTIGEGRRITVLDAGADTALAWARAMQLWGERELQRQQ